MNTNKTLKRIKSFVDGGPGSGPQGEGSGGAREGKREAREGVKKEGWFEGPERASKMQSMLEKKGFKVTSTGTKTGNMRLQKGETIVKINNWEGTFENTTGNGVGGDLESLSNFLENN